MAWTVFRQSLDPLAYLSCWGAGHGLKINDCPNAIQRWRHERRPWHSKHFYFIQLRLPANRSGIFRLLLTSDSPFWFRLRFNKESLIASLKEDRWWMGPELWLIKCRRTDAQCASSIRFVLSYFWAPSAGREAIASFLGGLSWYI